MKTITWISLGAALVLLSACASTKADPGSEDVHIINPYNESPYKTRCKDLDDVFSTGHGLGRFEAAIVGVRNQVHKLGGNIVITPKNALQIGLESVTLSGRALACPDDLVPKEPDRYQKMMQDQHRKWEQLDHETER